MRAAAQLEIVSRRRASVRKGHDVVILEEPALRAATGRAHERALATVAVPDCTSHRRRNVAAVGATRLRYPRSIHHSVLRLVQLRQEQRQRAIDDDGNIAVRNTVSQQILGLSKFVVGLTRDGDCTL